MNHALPAVALAASLLVPVCTSADPLVPDELRYRVTEKHNELIGEPMPELGLHDWFGEPLADDALDGKIVVIDFWATWCGPCVASMPHNNEVAAEYADRGVVFLGVCGSGDKDDFERICGEQDVAYPTAWCTEEAVEAWGVTWWPTYAIVGRDGKVISVGIFPASNVDVALDLILEAEAAETDSVEALAPEASE